MPSEQASKRYYLDHDAPNNTKIRHFGVWDHQTEDYAELPDGTYCYGMLYDEAARAFEELCSI